MNTPHRLRHLIAAVLVGVLVGGGLMATTPAGAQVAQVATNWKKIFKKKIAPHSDKRYYKKADADAKYATKADADARYAAKSSLADFYSKAQSDARYAGAGTAYTKTESDGKYVAKTMLRRGTFAVGATAAGASTFMLDSISFGVTLAAPPVAHYIPAGSPVPAGCSGTPDAPDALAGHLCVFESSTLNTSGTAVYNINTGAGSSTMGAWVRSLSAGAGIAYVGGSWAMRPGTVAAGLRPPVSGGRLVPQG